MAVPPGQAIYSLYTGGASFVQGKEDATLNGQLIKGLTLGHYRTRLESSQGGYLGVGAKIYLTRKKGLFLDLNYRWLFLGSTDLVITNFNTVSRRRVNPSAFMSLFGLGFSF